MNHAVPVLDPGLLPRPELRGIRYQNVSEGFFESANTQAGSAEFEPQSLLGGAAQNPTIRVLGYLEGNTSNGTATTGVRPARTAEALRLLKEFKRKAQQEAQAALEMQWLAENRQRFAGRWIALEGRTLLATGNTAREVFSKVGDRLTPPVGDPDRRGSALRRLVSHLETLTFHKRVSYLTSKSE